jgi:hypothetical protein
MTIIAGLVGSDGIVLAADGRMVAPASHAGQCDNISSIVKIVLVPGHGVAYAATGDYISWQTGQLLSEAPENDQFDFAHIQRSLQQIGTKAFEYERTVIEKTIAELAPWGTPEYLRLNDSAFLVKAPCSIGNVFIVAKSEGRYRRPWSIAQPQQSTGKEAQIPAAWLPEGARHGREDRIGRYPAAPGR